MRKLTLWSWLLPLGLLILNGCVSTAPSQSVDEDAARYNTQLAVGYLRRGDVDLAMEKVDKALAQDSRFAEAHLVKGMLMARAEEYRDADRHYRRAARLAPDNINVLSNVAAYYCERGRYKDGEQMFLEAATNPTNNRPPVAFTNAGRCARKIPAPDRAEAHFRRALEQEPNYAPALRQMAELSLDQSELMPARAFLQRLEGVQRLGPDGLLLGVKIERALKDRAAERRYADILLRDFPESDQAKALFAEIDGGLND